MSSHALSLKKVAVHNLKGIDLTLEPNQLIVFTGVSGSGKSSMAFDTIYVEGQRRYVESLSAFARRYLGELAKPDLESADGLSPTISIEQKTAGRNPRSTVGTMTEIYDFLRVLFARVATPYCPVSGEKVLPQSKERIIKLVQEMPRGVRLVILAPYARGKKGEFLEDLKFFLRKGFLRARIDGQMVSLEEEIQLDKTRSHDIDIVTDRITVEPENHSRIAEALTQALEIGQGVLSVVSADSDEETLYSMHAYSPKSGLSYPALEPHDFSFNSPSGMCSTCNGLGTMQEFHLEKIIDENLSIAQDCCRIASSYATVRYGNIYNNLARIYHFDVHTPWKKLSEKAKQVFLYGSEKKWLKMEFVHPSRPLVWTDHIQWRGVLYEARMRFLGAKSQSYRKKMQPLLTEMPCRDCHGSRLKPYPSAARLCGKPIQEMAAMTVRNLLQTFQTLELNAQEHLIGDELVKEIRARLGFLNEVGLHYLTLDRSSPTLSGGEAQRVRLASQIGSGLVGVTYVLDEPSIGLHPRDNTRLIKTLKQLRDLGNTVIVVEHDEETIAAADTIVDFGPGPGYKGGRIVAQGSLSDILRAKDSLTAAYLSGKEEIAIPKKRRPIEADLSLTITGARHHNLKGIDVEIPLGVFVAVTGVSGSGKSSLISEILYPALSNLLHFGAQPVGAHQKIEGTEHIDKVISIDQTPIGRNPRSNPSTYIKLFDEIRDLFSQLPESKAKGFKAGRFSFNVKEGSCLHCHGMGMVKVDMDFLEDQWVTCNVCHNNRFDAETLSVHYKGKNIAEILQMSVLDASELFQAHPSISHKLQILKDVGLEYLSLGQPSPTLSGGEAQRIKLAKELVRPSTGKTLYLLDEPTTGLHFHDIKQLLFVLHRLVELGNTVLVIEHNMDVIKTADWILDLGPDGGEAGGYLVAKGKPEALAKNDTPTGRALKQTLSGEMQAHIKALAKQKKEKQKPVQSPPIVVKGASQHNLKHLNITLTRGAITACSGPSGSGKSSFAFDTIYAEGQRRYTESLSPYARQFVEQMPKPKVESIEGLSPSIAIEQKANAGNPRSTVGTLTEVYDYLRLLYAQLGTPHCPETGEVIRSISKEFVVEKLMTLAEGTSLHIMAPLELEKHESFEEMQDKLARQGFLRVRLNGEFYELDAPIPFDKRRKNALFLVIDRLKLSKESTSRLYEGISSAANYGKNKLMILQGAKEMPFNLSFAVESTGKSYPPITPHTFAFNVSEGMCMECQGLGFIYGADLSRHPQFSKDSIEDLLLFFWGYYGRKRLPAPVATALAIATVFMEAEEIDLDTAISELSADKYHLLMNGSDKWYAFKGSGFSFQWRGINKTLEKGGKMGVSSLKEGLLPLLDEVVCPSCDGMRLNPLARNVRIGKLSLGQLCRLPTQDALAFLEKIAVPKAQQKLLEEVLHQSISRLRFLTEVGLHYMALERAAPTLSNGEAQRIRLARQLGSGLTGVLYVLDEPTTGLHPSDSDRLNQALLRLKSLGNTLLLVEHDPQTLKIADWILDFGPKAGDSGGYLVAQGTLKQIKNDKNSLTGLYLSGKKSIPVPSSRRTSDKQIEIKKASVHNLKHIDVSFPIKSFCCLSGVSGSGKSTLMHNILRPAFESALSGKPKPKAVEVKGTEHFDKLICLDQNPIGHTVRADVGTYVDIYTRLREFYTSLPEAKVRGMRPRHFSYNHRKGMCTTCFGLGYRRVYLQFMPPVNVKCDACNGMRLNPLSLSVLYKGKHLGHILHATVSEARLIFESHPRIVRLLDTLISVGLGYLKLGQEVSTLSGGEAQRLKLSRELAKRSTGKTLYLFDEPTTGLHQEDILKLLDIFQALVDKGNTLIVIEHHLDVLKNADYIVELGPKAGDEGGYLVYSGTPEGMLSSKKSATAPFLLKDLELRLQQ